MTLVPLYDLTQQFNNKNGAILVGGRLYVYYVGRTELATTWADEDAAAQNTNPVLLDNNGRAPVFVDDSYSYTLVVCDRAGTELFSQDITPGGAGSVGGRIVYHDETLSGAGTVSSLLGVVNIPLGVDETMTAYTGVAEGKDALILGVNGDWFNETFSGEFDQKVDWETFSACCSAVKGGLDNKLDASAINNYYTKNEVDERTSSFVNYNFLSGNYYNKFETSSREELYSAFLSAGQGGGGSGDCPWISGAKILADTQTLTDNMIVQVLSSFTLSGYHNHCIGVKGGVYRFPNRWEIASGIAETNYFMPQSAMSGYLPTSSFNSFIENGFNPNINALYSSASNLITSSNWLINNKLDISAFSAWTADQGNTYTLVGGDFVNISSDDEAETTTISVTGVPGQGEIDNVVNTLSSFSGSWNESTTVVQNNSAAWYDGNTEVNSYVQNNSATINNITNTVESNSAEWARNDGDSAVNEVVRTYSAEGTWLTSHQDLSDYATKQWVEDKGYITGVDLTPYQEKSGMTAYQPVSSMTSYYTTGDAYTLSSFFSGEIGNKLDISSFEAYTANDETYTLIGGKDIGISSDDVNKETTIYFTGSNGDEEVNTVVHNYSANGTWLTAHQIIPSAKWEEASDVVQTNSADWSNGGDSYTALTSNSAIWNDITVYQSHSGDYITAHQVIPSSKWEDASDTVQTNSAQWAENTGDTAVNNFVYNNSASITSVNNSGALWNAVYDLVATYSAKWLINGDV